ncbi:MAG TPA: phage holin family protein [Actinophytocola sp.]|uniref:phage holin family protein n=1 Tax=Actinophytocola sp. TaxID=1872138 RepID=UPI002DDD0C42|nr:phage holin family protein [Actinophytocola sp.]HEV2784145.1 phage holin family protein [Actinophytocola sp.]
MDTVETHDRTMAQLVSDLSEQTARLVRTEARLAAREMAGKARRAGFGTGALGAAAILAGYAGAMLLACVALALATVLPAWLATLLIGIALLAAAGVAALVGRAQLRKALPPVPDNTITRVRDDIDAVRERTHQ